VLFAECFELRREQPWQQCCEKRRPRVPLTPPTCWPSPTTSGV